jgi:hypothetical protein
VLMDIGGGLGWGEVVYVRGAVNIICGVETNNWSDFTVSHRLL